MLNRLYSSIFARFAERSALSDVHAVPLLQSPIDLGLASFLQKRIDL
jgi:hypothetical protein